MASTHWSGDSLLELRRGALRAKQHAEKLKDRIDGGLTSLGHAGIAAGTAFAFGLANGKVGGGGLTVPGIGLPADLAAGVVLLAVPVLTGMKDDKATKYQFAAAGALGSYFSTLGAQYGNRWKTTGKLPIPVLSGIFGDDSTTGGGSLADDELARMVRAG